MKAIVFNVGLPPSVGGAATGLFLVLSSMPVTHRPLARSDLQGRRS
jgi:hypothetical protein